MHSISARADMPLKGNESVVGLLFQESVAGVYSFLKQQLLKRGSTQKPVQRRHEWLHTGRPNHVTADWHSNALRLYLSVESKFLVLYP